MGGIKMSLTSEVTIFPKAAPRMIPMAMSSTFPRMANSLNSFSMFLSSFNAVVSLSACQFVSLSVCQSKLTD